MKTIPTFLTLLRLVLLPAVITVFYLPIDYSNYWAAGAFAVIAFTDWLDGFVARALNQSSSFGAFLDPVADKISVVAGLAIVVEAYGVWWITIPTIVIVSREITISALREWMAEAGASASVSVSFLGKVKTSAQMGAIVWLVAIDINHPWLWFGLTLLYIAMALTIGSMVQYFLASWQRLKKP